MSTYGQYCPMARSVEILGDRWTLLIVRDLFCGAEHFNELERGLPGISRALLSQRLRRLEKYGIVTRYSAPTGRKITYHLTQAGLDLIPVVESLTRWGARWAFGEPRQDELKPLLLMVWMRSRVCRENLPPGRIVVEFRFPETRPRDYWMVFTPEDVSICITHPGFDVDLYITADLASLYKVWVGRLSFSTALANNQIHIDAPADYARAFPTWFALSPAAGIVREEMGLRE